MLALGLTWALLWILGSQSPSVVTAPSAGHLKTANTPAAELHVCPSGCAYSSVQAAVDAASDEDVIKVAAGTYTGVEIRARDGFTTTGVVTQVVYISKTVTVQGGYTTADWTTPDPVANPTTLDAEGQGRVFYITGDISPTIEGLMISGGHEEAGGGIFVITATATITGNWVYSNSATVFGGGIGVYSSNNTILGENTITGNTSDFMGEG